MHLLRGLGDKQGLTQIIGGFGKLAKALSYWQFVEAGVLLVIAGASLAFGMMGNEQLISVAKRVLLDIKVLQQYIGFLANGL